MIKAERISANDNIFYFLNEHSSDLKVKFSDNKVIDVIFPENCTSKTLILIDGKISYLQYSIAGYECFTYDISKDNDYEKHINLVLKNLV